MSDLGAATVGMDRRALRGVESGGRGVGLISRRDFPQAQIRLAERSADGQFTVLLGTPQVTSGNHAQIVESLARARFADGTADYIVMNRSLKTATGRTDLGAVANWRPDIAVARRDGRVDIYEVQSGRPEDLLPPAGQTEAELIAKLKAMRDALPEANRGDIVLYNRFGDPVVIPPG